MTVQSAYVLHSRPYRETSLLVDFLIAEEGRLSTVARGVQGKRSSKRQLLQPFTLLAIDWSGSGELKTLISLEEQAPRLPLIGDALYAGLYLNELLVKLLRTQDSVGTLFDVYEHALQKLALQAPIEPVLRRFERQLLDELGFGIPFPRWEINDSVQYYFYSPGGEFIAQSAEQLDASHRARCFSVAELSAIAADKFDHTDCARAGKRLMRLALAPLLGGRELKSRALFTKRKENNE